MKDKIKIITATIAASLILGSCGTGVQSAGETTVTEISQPTTEVITQTSEPIKLTNLMTDKEKASAKKTGLRILDQTWEKEEKEKPSYDGVWIVPTVRESIIADIENTDFGDEAYKNELLEKYRAYPDGYIFIFNAIVDNTILYEFLPGGNYDGGSGTYEESLPIGNGEYKSTTIEYSDFADFRIKLRETCDRSVEAYVNTASENETIRPVINEYRSSMENNYNNIYDLTIKLYQAVIDGNYKTVTDEEVAEFSDIMVEESLSDTDSSLEWDFDRAVVESFRNMIDEYEIYDEELDLKFVIHVMAPPGYDSSQSYPALVLTDAVWRFSDLPKLYGEMKKRNGTPAILVSIGYDYAISGSDTNFRLRLFCGQEKLLLDFITDNLMPYLGENYNIDFGRSVLFGHSDAGVFSHYAAFNSDKYDNQPFGAYIIGSPAFWNSYFHNTREANEYINDYGYFDRNEKLGKKLFITGGSDEDEDYADYYGGNDSTLEGIEKLRQRLEAHGAENYEVKLYKSHHYQYVPEMLIEYIDERI